MQVHSLWKASVAAVPREVRWLAWRQKLGRVFCVLHLHLHLDGDIVLVSFCFFLTSTYTRRG